MLRVNVFKTRSHLVSHLSINRVGMIIFGSVRFLSKKVTKPKLFFLKKNRNRVKPTGFGSVFLGKKPVQTGLTRFFRFWLGFFSGFLSVSVRFGSVFVYKTETEPAGFFKNLIGFFFGSVFSVIFFPVFSV